MNICFVESNYPGRFSGGGAGTYVQLIAKELMRRGHKAFVIARYLDSEPPESDDGGILVSRPKTGNLSWYLGKIPLIGSILAKVSQIVESSLAINAAIDTLDKKHRLDVVEFSENANFLYVFKKHTPYIVHLHGSNVTFKKYCREKIFFQDRIQRCLEGFVMRRARLITSPSAFLKNEVVEEFNIAASKILVIPYPLDEKLLQSEHRADKDNKIVFYSGRLEKRKGVHTLQEAIPLVLKKYLQVMFMLFGSDSKDMARAGLQKYFQQRGVAERVKLCPFCPKEELFNYLSEADICVIPSVWDNSPNTIYEAMAAQKAIVATAVGGIPELIENNIQGVLVEPEDAKGLSQAIGDILENENKRKQLGQRAREKAIKIFNMDNIIRQRLAIYEQVAARQ
jgi:glycosyltransferase involved in cell wall biosynthesis